MITGKKQKLIDYSKTRLSRSITKKILKPKENNRKKRRGIKLLLNFPNGMISECEEM
jgi:hypothetical protein